jgi:hypothetical protein
MKIIEGLTLANLEAKGNFNPICFEIPDSSRDDLPDFFVEMGFNIGVEVGTREGEFAEKLCVPGLKLFAVDPYDAYDDYNQTKDKNWQGTQNRIFDEAQKRLDPYDCTFIRRKSMDSLCLFKDEMLDFVYIDGNHTANYVLNDIVEWSKKVRKGGVISGHDYVYMKNNKVGFEDMHVRQVVDFYVRLYNISPLIIIGSKDKKEGEKRDKVRSWMWIKK